MRFEGSREQYTGTTEQRAKAAMNLLRKKKFPTLPACIAQVLRNERITDPNDVKRIIGETATFLAKKKKEDDWNFLRESIRELEALSMQKDRGGDPDENEFLEDIEN